MCQYLDTNDVKRTDTDKSACVNFWKKCIRSGPRYSHCDRYAPFKNILKPPLKKNPRRNPSPNDFLCWITPLPRTIGLCWYKRPPPPRRHPPPFPALPFPSLPCPSLPFPSLPFPSPRPGRPDGDGPPRPPVAGFRPGKAAAALDGRALQGLAKRVGVSSMGMGMGMGMGGGPTRPPCGGTWVPDSR